ncbi:MAG: Gfo/Idh/MocA family oxidoreductase [Gemmataceae bacterium]|nr:Gfo/Idh/MocA family oxidoreductase [Gemmataceae bacterium]
MQHGNLSRRGFLAKSLGGMTAAGLPIWFANENLNYAQDNSGKARASNNDVLRMAAIGTGTNRTRRNANQPLRGERGVHIMQAAMGQPGVRMTAVCDVDRPNAEFAKDLVDMANGNRDCRVYGDFRELLQNRDIDAVTIGVPDHWHALIAIAAMKAGKDVYCEKPLTLTLEEGKALVKVARDTGKIVQTGSQQRSEFNGRFRLACELVRNGRIGKLTKITTLIGDNPQGGPFRSTPAPEGLNWDFWQGPTQQVDYVPERCFYEFRWWYEYSGGKMTDWGAHHNDIAQWALNMDNSGPIAIRSTAEAPTSNQPNSYNCHKNFEVVYTYGDGPDGGAGTELVCRANPPQGWRIRNERGQSPNNGILFEGEGGKWIFVSRGELFASDKAIIDEALPQNATRLEVATGNNHMANFLACVKSRRAPICNPTVGHRSCSVCHLGNISVRMGQALRWDPREERFIGDNAEAANRHLGRPYRAPWRLEA